MPRAIITAAEMVAAEQVAIAAGVDPTELMERAGAAAADAIQARFTRTTCVVWCGPGNNGGDGYVVARHLHEHGWSVRVEASAAPATPEARWAADRFAGPVHPLNPEGTSAGLYVDALFGLGLARPLSGDVESLGRARLAAPVVAIDLPSGLAADTGRAVGDGAVIPAALTVTFHRRKPAHALRSGRALCGEVVVADIGLGETPRQGCIFENEPGLWAPLMPWPDATSHKHARGRMVVVSGGPWNSGAARLAARAGLRIGAGVVTLLSPPEAMAINAAHLEAIMLSAFDGGEALGELAKNAGAAVIGPAAGVGKATRANLIALAKAGPALVVDADVLTTFKDAPSALFEHLGPNDVMTPHEGEFERLFPGRLAAAPERITAARNAAAEAGGVVLLKGSDTVVAAPDGRCAIALNGSPWLATAGSGDTLAGFIAGLIAQGMPAFEAACAGAWIHAECAQAFGPGLIAEDLPDLAPAVLRRLYEARGR